MKIKSRDLGWLAVGFFLGAVLTALLRTTPTRPAAPVSTFVLTGPVLAALAPAPPAVTAAVAVSNIELRASGVQSVAPAERIETFHPGDPLYPGMPGRLHLIDMRYQPSFNGDGLK